MPDNIFGEEIIPIIQYKPLLVLLGAVYFVLWPAFWDNSLNSHVSTASCQAVEESKKVPPKPPSLQAEQGEFQ